MAETLIAVTSRVAPTVLQADRIRVANYACPQTNARKEWIHGHQPAVRRRGGLPAVVLWASVTDRPRPDTDGAEANIYKSN